MSSNIICPITRQAVDVEYSHKYGVWYYKINIDNKNIQITIHDQLYRIIGDSYPKTINLLKEESEKLILAFKIAFREQLLSNSLEFKPICWDCRQSVNEVMDLKKIFEENHLIYDKSSISIDLFEGTFSNHKKMYYINNSSSCWGLFLLSSYEELVNMLMQNGYTIGKDGNVSKSKNNMNIEIKGQTQIGTNNIINNKNNRIGNNTSKKSSKETWSIIGAIIAAIAFVAWIVVEIYR